MNRIETQDDLWALNARLHPDNHDAQMMAVPGTAPEVRAAWLLSSQRAILVEHCQITGDDPDELAAKITALILREHEQGLGPRAFTATGPDDDGALF